MIDFPTTLTTERLTLRRLNDADLPALFAIFSDPEVMRFWSSPPHAEIDVTRRMLENVTGGYRSGDFFQIGIERRSDSALIGTCTVHQIQTESRRAEIGYALGRPFWGAGYMREALTVLFDHAFGALDFNRFEADIDPRNTASARVLERLGFEKEGFLRERWIVAGEICDSALYGLLRRDWMERKR